LAEEDYYGGPPFLVDDASTHWTEPHQLYTWWKNNVERKVKYKVLQEDATYSGPDHRRAARARWCAVVVSLAEVIRCSSGSTLQAKTLLNVAANFEARRSHPEITGSPELSHFGVGVVPYHLPSFKYQLGGKTQSPPLTKMPDGFHETTLHGGDGPVSLLKNLVPPTSPRGTPSSGYNINGVGHSSHGRDTPQNLLGPPQLLLGDGQSLTSSSSTPNGYFVRQLPPWTEELDLAKIMQGHTPNLNAAWKEEAARAKEALAHKRALFKERSDQIKAASANPQKGYQQAFPLKLFDLVTEQNNEIIGWLPDGHAFKVRHMENFVNIILPAYFKRESFHSLPIPSLPPPSHLAQMRISRAFNDNSIYMASAARKSRTKAHTITSTSRRGKGISPLVSGDF
jgi:hypothetical protein